MLKLILLMVLLLSFAPGEAQSATACLSSIGLNRFGVNEPLGWPALYPPERLETSLSLMEAAGIGWVRVNWVWKDIQPQPGDDFDYAHLDDITRIAAEHHVKIVAILIAVPAWASTAPDALKAERGSLSPVDKYRPQHLDDWLRYVQKTVERYDGDGIDDAPGSPSIGYWEVWNEPNLSLFWPPAPDPAEYFALLSATYQTIKASDASAQVVLGGLANADGGYLQRLYDLGGGDFFDIASIHVYSYPPRGIDPVQSTVAAARAMMDANGDSAKPLWLTEIGWSDAENAWGAPTVSPQAIADYLTAVYSAPLPVDLIFWYNFRNIFPDSPDVEHNFGLVDANFTPKPAFDAYRALAEVCKP